MNRHEFMRGMKDVTLATIMMTGMMIAVMAIVGCRSTKTTEISSKVSHSADTLVTEIRTDRSVTDYKAKYDSLMSLVTERDGTLVVHEAKDSTYMGRWNSEWTRVKDSMDVKVDTLTGKVSYYFWNTTESRYVTHDTIYKERSVRDSSRWEHEIAYMRERITMLEDSINDMLAYYDSTYQSKADSTSNEVTEEKVIEKRGLLDWIKNTWMAIIVIVAVSMIVSSILDKMRG